MSSQGVVSDVSVASRLSTNSERGRSAIMRTWCKSLKENTQFRFRSFKSSKDVFGLFSLRVIVNLISKNKLWLTVTNLQCYLFMCCISWQEQICILFDESLEQSVCTCRLTKHNFFIHEISGVIILFPTTNYKPIVSTSGLKQVGVKTIAKFDGSILLTSYGRKKSEWWRQWKSRDIHVWQQHSLERILGSSVVLDFLLEAVSGPFLYTRFVLLLPQRHLIDIKLGEGQHMRGWEKRRTRSGNKGFVKLKSKQRFWKLSEPKLEHTSSHVNVKLSQIRKRIFGCKSREKINNLKILSRIIKW